MNQTTLTIKAATGFQGLRLIRELRKIKDREIMTEGLMRMVPGITRARLDMLDPYELEQFWLTIFTKL